MSYRSATRLALYGVECRVVSESSPPVSAATTSVNDSSTAAISTSPIRSSVAQHRALVALRDFEAGAIILQSTPHSFVLTPLPVATAASEPDSSGGRARCEWCHGTVGDRCLATNGPIEKLSRCSQCHLVSYCSQPCQKQAWKAYHAFECKHLWTQAHKLELLDRLAPEAKLDLILLGRCIRKRQKEEASQDRITDSALQFECEKQGAPLQSSFDDLCAMESHYEFLAKSIEEHGKQNAKAALAPSSASSNSADPTATATPSVTSSSSALSDATILSMAQRMTDNTQLIAIGFRLGLFGPGITPDDVTPLLLPLLTAFQSNNFAITNELLLTAGAGIYPLGAILNHSCEPNCVILYESRRKGDPLDPRCGQRPPASLSDTPPYPDTYHHIQMIRTIRPVKVGEELTHSYIDFAAITATRRQQLADRYYFHCRCTRCVRDEDGTNPTSYERFLEKDIDGRQLPDDILNYEFETSPSNKPSSSPVVAISSTSFPKDRHTALLRANKLWHEATEIHMVDNTAQDSTAFAAEEQRRNQHEQVLITSALQLRLQHLHPYCIQLVTTYSKLLHIALLNGDFSGGINACEQLCRKYRIIYGDGQIRAEEFERLEKRKIVDQERERKSQIQPTEMKTQLTSSADSDEEDDDDTLDHISDYPPAALPIHPLLGLQLYTLASLYGELKSHRLAFRTYSSALRILLVTHGDRHDLVARLKKEMHSQELALGCSDSKVELAQHNFVNLTGKITSESKSVSTASADPTITLSTNAPSLSSSSSPTVAPPSTSVPQPRLVGIELNPGPGGLGFGGICDRCGYQNIPTANHCQNPVGCADDVSSCRIDRSELRADRSPRSKSRSRSRSRSPQIRSPSTPDLDQLQTSITTPIPLPSSTTDMEITVDERLQPNPSTSQPTSTDPSHTRIDLSVTSTNDRSLIFKDGLHLIYSYLTNEEWFSAFLTCQLWYKAIWSEPSRHLLCPLEVHQVKDRWRITGSPILLSVNSPMHHMITRVRCRFLQVEDEQSSRELIYPKLTIPALVTCMVTYPNLTEIDIQIDESSSDLAATSWPSHLTSLVVQVTGNYPLFLSSIFHSCHQLKKLNFSSHLPLAAADGVTNNESRMVAAAHPFEGINQLTKLEIFHYSVKAGPIFRPEDLQLLPHSIKQLSISPPLALTNFPLMPNIQIYDHTEFQPGQLQQLHMAMPNLTEIGNKHSSSLVRADLGALKLFKSLRTITFDKFDCPDNDPRLSSDLLSILSQCPSLTAIKVDDVRNWFGHHVLYRPQLWVSLAPHLPNLTHLEFFHSNGELVDALVGFADRLKILRLSHGLNGAHSNHQRSFSYFTHAFESLFKLTRLEDLYICVETLRFRKRQYRHLREELCNPDDLPALRRCYIQGRGIEEEWEWNGISPKPPRFCEDFDSGSDDEEDRDDPERQRESDHEDEDEDEDEDEEEVDG